MAVPALNAYFDESGSHDGAHCLCVAGLLFRQDEVLEFSRQWKTWLEFYDVPYFRMSQVAHCRGPFEKLGRKNCIRLEKKMLSLINTYAKAIFAVTLVEKEYGGPLKELNPVGGGAYSFALASCMGALAEFCEKGKYPWEGSISYFFESGHRDQSEANRMLTQVFETPRSRTFCRYASHAFMQKEDSPPLQAADIIAWQWYTDRRRQSEGKPRRKDCEALLSKVFYLATHVSQAGLIETIARRAREGTLFRDEPPES